MILAWCSKFFGVASRRRYAAYKLMNDRILGLLALLLAAFMFWESREMVPAFSYEPLGPRAFPMLLSIFIAFCGLVLLFKGQYHSAPLATKTRIRLALLALSLLGYAILFIPLGFIIATSLAILAIGSLFGASPAPLLSASIIAPITLYFLFDQLLDVVLPLGILEKLL